MPFARFLQEKTRQDFVAWERTEKETKYPTSFSKGLSKFILPVLPTFHVRKRRGEWAKKNRQSNCLIRDSRQVIHTGLCIFFTNTRFFCFCIVVRAMYVSSLVMRSWIEIIRRSTSYLAGTYYRWKSDGWGLYLLGQTGKYHPLQYGGAPGARR